MPEPTSFSKIRTVVGCGLLALGVAVFAVRLLHEGAYALPRGANLFGGLGALLLGGVLAWPATPRWLGWLALAASPVVLFSGLYATMAELEEVVSLYAIDSAGNAAELRLWIVDREDGVWVGMPRWKALEHSLDGARLQLLRSGETRCVVPVLHEDRATVRAIHALKVEKYAVARGAAAIGLYPREARETSVSLRLDPCTVLAEPNDALPLTPRGLITKEAGVAPGFVLFGPILSDIIYLIDNDGQVVHQWKSAYSGSAGYLLENGNLLRAGRDPDALHFRAGGVNGIVQEIAWDGTVVWEWKLSEKGRILHHDIEPLPNGNLLAIAWEAKTREEALRAGRRPGTMPEQGLHPDFVLEIEPLPPNDAKIVWEWHVWDHLVQNHDPEALHYGEPAEHPGRLDINAMVAAPELSADELERLKALGYMPPDAKPQDVDADFLHINSIDYNAALDQFVLSVPRLGEIWIVDHSTTTAEAASSSGGRAGRGGDLLYRWGNPAVYGRGAPSSQRLFFQHDTQWVPRSFPGAGELTIFNNGRNRPDGGPSTVDQIATPVGPDGDYVLEAGKPYGPAEPSWSWSLPADRFAPFISGAERQPNGNTLVCSGPGGILLEVTASGKIVWEYRNPFSGDVKLADGSPPQPVGRGEPYAVFRATRIDPDHPGLRDKKLVPRDPQPAWHSPTAVSE